MFLNKLRQLLKLLRNTCPCHNTTRHRSVLTLPAGRMPARQTPSAEATTRAQCASPTDLKVERTSLKLWQTSVREANECYSAYPMKQWNLQGYLSEEAMDWAIRWTAVLSSSWQRGQSVRQKIWTNAHETCNSIGATTSGISVQCAVITRFEWGTQHWCPHMEDFSNLGDRRLDC